MYRSILLCKRPRKACDRMRRMAGGRWPGWRSWPGGWWLAMAGWRSLGGLAGMGPSPFKGEVEFFALSHQLPLTFKSSGRLWSVVELKGSFPSILRSTYLSYPIVLSCPILTYPILSYPILTYPVLYCPILTCPVLNCPVLSYPTLRT